MPSHAEMVAAQALIVAAVVAFRCGQHGRGRRLLRQARRLIGG